MIPGSLQKTIMSEYLEKLDFVLNQPTETKEIIMGVLDHGKADNLRTWIGKIVESVESFWRRAFTFVSNKADLERPADTRGKSGKLVLRFKETSLCR